MKRKTGAEPVILGPHHPVPTRALWELLKHLDIPRHSDGTRKAGYEDAAKAHLTVTTWLGRVEEALGLPSFGEDRYKHELDPYQAQIGLCLYCRLNDGYLEVDGKYWGVCHEHEVCWPVAEELIREAFRPSSGESELSGREPDEGPPKGYLVIEPEELRPEILEGGDISWLQVFAQLIFPKKR